jgi:hypothetical protein
MRIIVYLLAVGLSGCAATGQLSKNTETTDFSLDPAALDAGGIGFLTPISATGQEADRVGVAIAFADQVAEEAGLASGYKQMMTDYQATGLLEKDTLKQVGEASGARYLGLLNLARFSQNSNKRFSIGGLRLMDTKEATLRISWQIWDSQTGAIAWEGSDEINYAYDTGRERPVNLAFVTGQAATAMLAEFPATGDAESSPVVASLTSAR